MNGNDPRTNLSLDGFDLPRRGVRATEQEHPKLADIPDPRNDENLAVGQTHLAFMRFHNANVVQLASRATPSAQLFDRAREMTVKHYQWMLRHDFLPRIVRPDILEDVFTNGRRVVQLPADQKPAVPIEFSVAAYRFGHSMIRDDYDWNVFFNSRAGAIAPGSLLNLFRFSGTSGNLSPPGPKGPTDFNDPREGRFERLPTNWVADWTRLVDFERDAGLADLAPEPGATLNLARRIDTRLTDPLASLPIGSFSKRDAETVVPTNPLDLNLAFRNLMRSRMVGLATGQEVAAHLAAKGAAVTNLSAQEILVGAGDGLDLSGLSAELQTEAIENTPLWFYILREAELNDGKLGDVGGRIVAETFHMAMEASRISILRDPTWRPEPGRHPGGFGMVDILLRAFKASVGELRPLSPDAPKPTSDGQEPRRISVVGAILDKQPPGKRARDRVAVTLPDLGSTAELRKRVPQGINPAILLLDVDVSPGGGVSGQAMTPREIRFEEDPAEQDYTSVVVAHGSDEARAEFSVVH